MEEFVERSQAPYSRFSHEVETVEQAREYLPSGWTLRPSSEGSGRYGPLYDLVNPSGNPVESSSFLTRLINSANARAASTTRATPRVEAIQEPPERVEGMLNSPRRSLPPSLAERSGGPVHPRDMDHWDWIVDNLAGIYGPGGAGGTRAVDQNRSAARFLSGILEISQRQAMDLMARADRIQTRARPQDPDASLPYERALQDAYQEIYNEIQARGGRRRRR